MPRLTPSHDGGALRGAVVVHGTMRAMSFAEAQDAFFSHFFRHYPVHATDAGNHEHDDRWPDLTDAGTTGPPGMAGRSPRGTSRRRTGSAARRRSIGASCSGVIDELRFEEEELDELSWSPISYSYILGSGLFSLLSREFAPLQARLASAAGRMEGIGDVLDAARANLSSGRGREVATFHVEKAIATMPGVADLCRTAASMAAELDDSMLRTRVESTAARAAGRGRGVRRLAAR